MTNDTDPDIREVTFEDFPSQPTQRGSAGEGTFIVSGTPELITVTIRAPEVLVRSVSKHYFDGEEPEPRTALRIDMKSKTISMFPQIMWFTDQLYKQKYDNLKEIQVELPGDEEPPETHDDVARIVKKLPSAFIKDPTYGLGVVMDMRPIIKSIEGVKGVTRLIIDKAEPTRVDRNTFYLNGFEFDVLRSGIARITRVHQQDSLSERELMAHNATLNAALPEIFPYKEPPYKPGSIHRLMGGGQRNTVPLRGRDRVAMLSALAANAKEIAKRDPKEFVQLQKDIEIVGLDRLIDSVNGHIRRNSNEATWQELFELNPFILSMLFGQPIVMFRPHADVGGGGFGAGSKVADFLGKNPLTFNAALVEIKRPKTELLGAAYRAGVYPPSRELMGAVTQVLDQRFKLTTSLATKRYFDKITELDVPSVQCVVVAGRNPTTEAMVNSLELIRQQFKDVQVLTYDELLERLQILRELLSGERYVSELPDDDAYDSATDGYESNYPVERDEEDMDPWG